LRQLLVENGTLNSDFTPNEATAQRLGWKLIDPEDVPIGQRWWLTTKQRTSMTQAARSRAAGTNPKGGRR